MRIGIMTSVSMTSFSHQVLIDLLQNSTPDDIFIGLVDTRPGKTPLAKFKRNLKKGRGFFIFVLFAKFVIKRIKNIVQTPKRIPNVNKIYDDYGINYFFTSKPYSGEFCELVEKQKLDLLVYLSGFGVMIKEPLLSITPKGILSFHHGDIRRYRGQPAIFWEIYYGAPEMKVTIQKLEAGLDCGDIIIEKEFTIQPWETFQDVYENVYKNSVQLMRMAVLKIKNQNKGENSGGDLGKIYTLPSLNEYLYFLLQNFKRKIRKSIR